MKATISILSLLFLAAIFSTPGQAEDGSENLLTVPSDSDNRIPIEAANTLARGITSISPWSAKERFYYQGYGDISWRKTNMSRNDYNGVVGWFENRVVMKTLKIPYLASIDIFGRITPEISTHSTPWENRLVYGGGAEWRILEEIDFLQNTPELSWLAAIRLYFSYVEFVPIKDDYDGYHYDNRFGIGVYKDYGFPVQDEEGGSWDPEEIIWYELWGDVSWRKTDFSSELFESWLGGTSLKLGAKWPYLSTATPLMPYFIFDLSASEKSYSYQNRLIIGGGLRLMPFRAYEYEGYEWLYNIKIYGEYLNTVSYFKDDPDAGSPRYDFRAGVAFSYNFF